MRLNGSLEMYLMRWLVRDGKPFFMVSDKNNIEIAMVDFV